MSLPNSVSMIFGFEISDYDVEENGADLLSDRFGLCVNSFEYQIKETRNGFVIGFYNIEWDEEE